MLSKEALAANAALSELTDEQYAAIISESENDFGKRLGETYRQLDATIESATGVKRNGDEKTYKYLERATKEMGTAHAEEREALQAEVERLKTVIADGTADKATKDALAAAQRELTSVQNKYTELERKFDKKEKEHEAALFGVHVDNAISTAMASIKLKADIPSAVKDVVLKEVVSKVKAMHPEFATEAGSKVLVFKNEAGEIIRGEGLKVLGAGDILRNELRAMGVLDEGRKLTGTGTTAPDGNGGEPASVSVDISTAKTQVEAQEIIHKALTARGLVIGSKEYQTEMSKAYAAANIRELPLQ